MPPAVRLATCCALMTIGCGARTPTPPEPPPPVAQQEAEATRVFEIAQKSEKEGKTRDAAAAYRQVLRAFPKTSQGKQAAERLKRLPGGR